MTTPVEPVKDDEERPVPTAWRPVIREIVRAFVARDFSLSRRIPGVDIDVDTAARIERQLASYGETLIDLPDATWASSIAACEFGQRWQVLVDLWTAESGRSDLVLFLYVAEAEQGGYAYSIYSVHVP